MKKRIRVMKYNLFPKTDKELFFKTFSRLYVNTTATYSPTISIEKSSNLIMDYSEKINQYAELKEKYERALFSENYKKAQYYLGRIQALCGYSLWLLSQITTMQYLNPTRSDSFFKALDANSINNQIIHQILVKYEKMANPEVGFRDFLKEIYDVERNPDNLSKEKIDQIKYIEYKAGLREYEDERDFTLVLDADLEISLIDFYETYVEFLQYLVANHKYLQDVKAVSIRLYSVIKDFRIRNLALVFNADIPDGLFGDECIYLDYERYTSGEYTQITESIDNDYLSDHLDYDLYLTYIKAGINIGELGANHKLLWQVLYSVYHFQIRRQEAIEQIGRYYKLFYNTSLRNKLKQVLFRKLNFKNNNIKLEYDTFSSILLRLSILSDKILTPLFFQIFDSQSDQLKYLSRIEEVTPKSAALLSFSLTGNNAMINNKTIEESRRDFYYIKYLYSKNEWGVLIEESSKYIEKHCTNPQKIYYFERVGRLLVKAYLAKGYLIDALDFYVDCMAYNESVVTRMSLAEISERIVNNNEIYTYLKGSIEIVILLYTYYLYQIEKFIPFYMDFMEQYKSLSNYLKSISDYDIKCVYFLYHICNEDILIYDYISCNNIDATQLRISVLSKLALIDEQNAIIYQNELRSLSREELIHKRSKLFNHNRINVDKERLIEWLEKYPPYYDFTKFKRLYYALKDENAGIHTTLYTQQDILNEYVSTLKKIVSFVVDSYLLRAPFSLEHYLSTRIRHVFCESCLKADFEKHHLLNKKDSDDSQRYIVNTYWIKILPTADYSILAELLEQFTKNIEYKINEIVQTWLNIRMDSLGNEFFSYQSFEQKIWATFISDRLDNIESIIATEKTLYSFIIDELEKITESVKKRIRDEHIPKLSKYYGTELSNLKKSIKASPISSESYELLDQEIEMAMGTYVNDIKEFEEIFYSEEMEDFEFSIHDAIETCRTIEKQLNSHLDDIDWTIKCEWNKRYYGKIFSDILDILSILINNAIKHSEFDRMSDISITIKVGEASVDYGTKIKEKFYIEVSNNLNSNVDRNLIIKNLNEICTNIRDDNYEKMSVDSPHSGLYRVARIIEKNLEEPKPFFHWTYDINNDVFRIRLYLSLASHECEVV